MGVVSCGTTMLDQGVFENIGAVTWDTTAKTGDFTAVSGVGYFVNTTSSAISVTLPSSPSAGTVVGVSDYAGTAATNNITLARNSSNIEGNAEDFVIDQEGISITLVYVDATKGWITTDTGNSSNAFVNNYVVATGGTITCSGDYKIHTFTGPGTFCVSAAGTPAGSNIVDYFVVAGGGGAGSGGLDGGAGAGGFRGSSSTYCTPNSLLSPVSGLTVSTIDYPITIGAGGGGDGESGSNSSFSTITSTGGGGGGGGENGPTGASGGSGGGGIGSDGSFPGGAGNTPPVSPPQGNDGSTGSGTLGSTNNGGGAGGGAGEDGNAKSSGFGGPGGDGSFIPDTFFGPTAPTYGEPGPVGSTRYFAGGGGGGNHPTSPNSTRPGGVGGGGNGGNNTAGLANMGGGGGAGLNSTTEGGSGIVIIRYKFQ